MSPIFRANEKNEMIPVFMTKKALQARLTAAEALIRVDGDRLMAADLKLQSSSQLIARLTRENDELLARLATASLRALDHRNVRNWIGSQHVTNDRGRCSKCNVTAPCRTVRIVTGQEQL